MIPPLLEQAFRVMNPSLFIRKIWPALLLFFGWGEGRIEKTRASLFNSLFIVLRLTIRRCHLRSIIVNIRLNDGERAEVVERNKNHLSLYLPSCEFSVSVKKKTNRKNKKVEQRTAWDSKIFKGYNILNGLHNPRLLHLKLLMVCVPLFY